MEELPQYPSPEHYEHRRTQRTGSVITELAEQQQTEQQLPFGEQHG